MNKQNKRTRMCKNKHNNQHQTFRENEKIVLASDVFGLRRTPSDGWECLLEWGAVEIQVTNRYPCEKDAGATWQKKRPTPLR